MAPRYERRSDKLVPRAAPANQFATAVLRRHWTASAFTCRGSAMSRSSVSRLNEMSLPIVTVLMKGRALVAKIEQHALAAWLSGDFGRDAKAELRDADRQWDGWCCQTGLNYDSNPISY
jgi:hypothetical protein